MNEPLLFVLSELQEKEIIYSIYEFFQWRSDQEKYKEKQFDNTNNNKKKSNNITNNAINSGLSSTIFVQNKNCERNVPINNNHDNNNIEKISKYLRYQSVLDVLCKQFSKYESDFSSSTETFGRLPSLIVKLLKIDFSNTTQITVTQPQHNNSNNNQAVVRSPPMLNNQQAAITNTGGATIQNDKHGAKSKRQLENSQESIKAKKKSRVGIANKQSNTASTVCDRANTNDKNDSVKVTEKSTTTPSDNSNHHQPQAATSIKEKPIITNFTTTKPAANTRINNPNNNNKTHAGGSSAPVFYIKDKFDERYNELVHFKAFNGHILVPVQKSDLGRWVSAIRAKKRQMDKGEPCANSLSEEQIKKLDSLGFIWNASSAQDIEKDKFEERYNELVHFKAFNGHTRVPVRRHGLGFWISRIRAKKREMDHGKPCSNPLSQEQIDRLDSLGFDWNPIDPEKNVITFEQRLEALMKYKKVHNNCDIPRTFKDDPSLGEWVKDIRKKYRKKKLTAERIKKLENIGFRWRVRPEGQTKTFEERLEELVKFKEREGHCDITSRNCKDDPSLCWWVNRMRKTYREKNLEQDCIKKLEDIGFNWVVAPKTKTFEERVEQCRNYLQKHGHLKIPRPQGLNSQTEEYSFSRWAQRLRCDYKRWKAGEKSKRMNESRFNVLNEIGFDWTYDEVAERKREEEMLKKAKKDAPFYVRLQELKEVKEKVGSCNSLTDFVKGGYNMQSPLYKWVKLQRQNWKQSKLSEEKVKKLEELDFDFNPRKNDVQFDDRLQQLKELKEKVGSCSTRQDLLKGGYTCKSPLYKWAEQQRKNWKRSKLSEERRKKLEALNFDFQIWNNRLRKHRGQKMIKKVQKAKESTKQPSQKDENDGQCEESPTGDGGVKDNKTDSDEQPSSDEETELDGDEDSDEEAESDEKTDSDEEEPTSDNEEEEDSEISNNREDTEIRRQKIARRVHFI